MRIAILASGEGTNAENIIRYFKNKNHDFLILTNNPKSGVIDKSKILKVKVLTINKLDNLNLILKYNSIDFVILAGFLKLIPTDVINTFQKRIINIHPSLLPKYGGKGMWGMNVHKEVIRNKELESGITIHYVSEKYDEGQIIEQHKCEVLLCDTPEILAKKISLLEREHFPKCIEKLITL
jgi:phosphoribosylglycinamide formyltransferase-1